MIKNLELDRIFALGVPILFILALITHFIYELTGKNFVVGLLFPANESVFQHLKLFTVTGFLYYFLIYFAKKEEINAPLWFTSALISMLTIILLIPMLHYSFTQITGKESVLVDIFFSFLAVGIGQFIAMHYYKYGTAINANLAIVLMLCIIALFAILTIFPPKIPFFKDSLTNSYEVFSR